MKTQLKMALSRDLIRLILACLFIGISMAKENLISNEDSPLTDNQLIEKYKYAVDNLLKLDLDVGTLQSRLHLQSEIINSIRAGVLKTDTTTLKQCKTIEHFNELEFKLHRMKQNLIRLMNSNNDKHLDKIETILFKMQTFREETNNTQQLVEIKTRLSNTETKTTEFFKRLEILETNFQNIVKPQQENKEGIDSIVNQIHIKLDLQENILQTLNQPLNDLPKTSARDVNIISRLCHGNCIIKRIVESDKKMSVEKQKEVEN